MITNSAAKCSLSEHCAARMSIISGSAPTGHDQEHWAHVRTPQDLPDVPLAESAGRDAERGENPVARGR
jgi:hypothetical protein